MENYTRDDLLEVLQGYARMIERDNGQYPAVVLDDIYHSVKHVLKENGIDLDVLGREKPEGLPFERYLNYHKGDFFVKIEDKDGNLHPMPILHYYSEAARAFGKCEHSSEEKWMLTLPFKDLDADQGRVTLRTDFSRDEMIFLFPKNNLNAQRIKAGTKLSNLAVRAVYSDASFEDRLAYLTAGKSFEIPFDANSIDARHEEDRSILCDMLKNSDEVYVCGASWESYDAFAYSINPDPSSECINNEIAIRRTEPGKGLLSTMEGKIAWAQHLRNKAKAQAMLRGMRDHSSGPSRESPVL